MEVSRRGRGRVICIAQPWPARCHLYHRRV